MHVPFSRPAIDDEEIAAVERVMRSGWLTTGTETALFEAEFTQVVNAEHAISVSSATAGIAVVLAALDIGPGDEVICPVFTFASPAMEVHHRGATPIFVDCLPDTLNPDPASIAAAVTPRTKAIMVVHYAGLPCDLREVQSIADRHGIPVIEDAAHAFPAMYEGRQIGSSGSLFTVFSFYANKTMTTGEGGMITTNDRSMSEKCRRLRMHGIDRDVLARYTSTTAPWRYDVVHEGYKANLPDVLSAIGRVQLGKAQALRLKRERLAERYLQQQWPVLMPNMASSEDSLHAWHLFVIRVSPAYRDKLIASLRIRGVLCSVHFTPMFGFTFWRDRYACQAEAFPVAARAAEEVVSLPLFSTMTKEEQAHVMDSLALELKILSR